MGNWVSGKHIYGLDQMINLNFNLARQDLRDKIFNLEYSLREFETKAHALGLDVRNAKVTDEIIRVPLIGKKGLDGWYALHLDNEVLYGVFGNWVNGIQETYSSQVIVSGLFLPRFVCKVSGGVANVGIEPFQDLR